MSEIDKNKEQQKDYFLNKIDKSINFKKVDESISKITWLQELLENEELLFNQFLRDNKNNKDLDRFLDSIIEENTADP